MAVKFIGKEIAIKLLQLSPGVSYGYFFRQPCGWDHVFLDVDKTVTRIFKIQE